MEKFKERASVLGENIF